MKKGGSELKPGNKFFGKKLRKRLTKWEFEVK